MENKEQIETAPKEAEVDPKVKQEINSYVLGLSKMLHNKETSPKVVQMLKSGDPQVTIPETALLINGQMESALGEKGKKPSLDVLAAASQFLVGDLIEIGNAAGIFQLETEEQIAPILQNTMQKYIEKGLSDGSIDPVELQEKVEPLMSDRHRELGSMAGEASGVPTKPNQMTAMEAYANKKGMLKGGQ